MTAEKIKEALTLLNVPFETDASYNELQSLLSVSKKAAAAAETAAAEAAGTAAGAGEIPPPVEPTGETDKQRADRLEAENAQLRIKQGNKGIPTKPPAKQNKKLLRNSDRLAVGFQNAMVHTTHKNASVQEIQAVEYELRRFVKRGGPLMLNGKAVIKDNVPQVIPGGFRKGLTPEAKDLARALLTWLGRDPKDPAWDEDIVCFGMETVV
jgi:hypothetical protein